MPGVQRLADRIEDNLSVLLVRVEEILRSNERYVLALAHALETHKTLSGEDVVAVLEGTRGPLVDGAPYRDESFQAALDDYHLAAARAHREHSQEQLNMPAPAAPVPPWTAGVIAADGDPSGLNGHNPDQP